MKLTLVKIFINMITFLNVKNIFKYYSSIIFLVINPLYSDLSISTLTCTNIHLISTLAHFRWRKLLANVYFMFLNMV